MAATYDYITLTGTIVPDVSQISSDVQQEYLDAFGQDLITTPDTPQGVLITGEVLARISVARNNATLANQINPNLAGGVYFDAIWALTGGARNPNQFSTISDVALFGVAGTVIPEGATAKNSNGDIFSSLSTVTLDDLGNATVDFQCVVPGPIVCIASTLTQILPGNVLGWETVTNPNAAVLGSTTQSDESGRFYRRNTLALQGTSLPEAITSALYSIPGFKSLTFRENVTNATVVIDSVTLIAHSIYVCVDGATDTEVATTLLSKKSAGAAWNGSTTVNVTDPVSGQVYPVSFDRPTLIPIGVRVTIRQNLSVADPVQTVQNAILDYANGLISGEPGFVVGGNVSPFELSGAVNIQSSGLFVTKVEVTYLLTITYVVAELPIEIFQQATISISNILVVIV